MGSVVPKHWLLGPCGQGYGHPRSPKLLFTRCSLAVKNLFCRLAPPPPPQPLANGELVRRIFFLNIVILCLQHASSICLGQMMQQGSQGILLTKKVLRARCWSGECIEYVGLCNRNFLLPQRHCIQFYASRSLLERFVAEHK